MLTVSGFGFLSSWCEPTWVRNAFSTWYHFFRMPIAMTQGLFGLDWKGVMLHPEPGGASDPLRSILLQRIDLTRRSLQKDR